jgi:hypothetical protein
MEQSGCHVIVCGTSENLIFIPSLKLGTITTKIIIKAVTQTYQRIIRFS